VAALVNTSNGHVAARILGSTARANTGNSGVDLLQHLRNRTIQRSAILRWRSDLPYYLPNQPQPSYSVWYTCNVDVMILPLWAMFAI
jgi:hypothetical protein